MLQTRVRAHLSNFWMRNCLGCANNEASANWSSHARGTRHAHGVFENIGGPIGYIQDWDGGEQGSSDLKRHRLQEHYRQGLRDAAAMLWR